MREDFSFMKRGYVRVAVAIFTFLFCTFLSLGITSTISSIFQPITANILRAIQVTSSFCMFVLPVWIYECLFSYSPCESLSLNKCSSFYTFVTISLGLLLFLPFISLTEEWNTRLVSALLPTDLYDWVVRKEELSAQTLAFFIGKGNVWDIISGFFIIVILTSIFEEILFRGFIQNHLEEWQGNKHFAVWVSAFVFSTIHFQFNGFIPRMLMGAFLGYSLVCTRTLWIPIALHALNNLIGFLLKILLVRGVISCQWETFLWSEHFLIVVLSTMGSLLCFFVFIGNKYHNSKDKFIF